MKVKRKSKNTLPVSIKEDSYKSIINYFTSVFDIKPALCFPVQNAHERVTLLGQSGRAYFG